MIKKSVKKAGRFVLNHLPDGLTLRIIYYRSFGRILHLNHPKSFTEKIQWMKVNYRLPIVPLLGGKYTVRDYVEKKIGAAVLCELYGVWDRPEDIPFDDLPDQFALKVTLASHANLFCRDKSKFDRNDAIQKLRRWMAINYYTKNREWAYRDMKPRIVAEELLDDGTGVSPADYKFYCFDGEPDFIEVDMGRHERLSINLLSLDWKPLPFTYYSYSPRTDPIDVPANLAEMTRFARILSKGFPFSRIDFYSIHGKTVFGEFSWYPGAGLAPFQPIEWNRKIGDKIRLPKPQ